MIDCIDFTHTIIIQINGLSEIKSILGAFLYLLRRIVDVAFWQCVHADC